MFLRHPMLSLATFAYLGVVAWLTLGPQPFPTGSDSIVWWFLDRANRVLPAPGVSYAQLEFAGNVLMFLPIGLFFLLLFGRRRWWFAILLGVCLTAAIEFTQLFLPGRVSDPRDILANSVGAALGVLLALALTASAARRERRASGATPLRKSRKRPA